MTEIKKERKSNIITKKCTKCEKEFPVTSEFFPRNKNTKDGFQNWCKDCKNEDNKEWRETNPEYMKKYFKEWYENNREYKNEANKEWRENNPEHIKQYMKEWNKNNPDYMEQWNKNNLEYKKEYYRKLKKENPKRYLEHLRINKIHKWAYKNVPYIEPEDHSICTICNERSDKTLDCANVDHKYIKDSQYWVRVCQSCHRMFDKINQTHKKNTDRR